MTSPSPPPPAQDDIVAWLIDPATHGGQLIRHVETHISHVVLVGDDVYKMKRDIRLPFVDFSTLALREAACRAEITVNMRTAPDIYRDVVPVTFSGETLAIGGRGMPVEWLVRMRRFDEALLFDRLARRRALTDTRILGLADAVADLHMSEPPVMSPEVVSAFGWTLADLVANLKGQTAGTPVEEVASLWTARAERAFRESEGRIVDRALSGHVHRGHGDLHLGNICEIDSHVRLFDAIEFDPAMATVDVLYDLSFAMMDLIHRDLKPQATLMLGRYLGATRDYSGLGVLALFMSTRAAIRALVAMLSGAPQAEALDYLRLAIALLLPPPPPRLIAVGGRSGTGKTTCARLLAASCSGPFGAVLIRSDTTRKRIAGVPPEEHLPGAAYTGAAGVAVYARMAADAREGLIAGSSVILDATFLNAEARDLVARTAARAGVPFEGIWLTGEQEVLEARIGTRGYDASDADIAVLRRQREPEDLRGWRIVDVSEQSFDAAFLDSLI